MLRWLGQLPAGSLFVVTVGVGIGLTLLLDAGMRRWVSPETRQRASATAAVTLQVTATIYAILIAFVIVDEYNQQRAVQEQISTKAAALSVVFENSRTLPEAVGHDIREAALAYARSTIDHAFPHLEETARPERATDRHLEKLFDAVHAAPVATDAQREAYAAMLRGLDDVVATREQIINSARASVPDALVWLLLVIGVCVMGVATMLDTRHRASHLMILSILALVIWLTLALVIAMDYPFGGFIRVTDAPIREFIQFRAAR